LCLIHNLIHDGKEWESVLKFVIENNVNDEINCDTWYSKCRKFTHE